MPRVAVSNRAPSTGRVAASGRTAKAIAVARFPVEVPGLVLRFDAALGVTFDASGRVSQWIDQASGFIAPQATIAKRPIYKGSDVNLRGLPSLGFSAAAVSALVNTTDTPIALSSPRTVFAAFKVSGTIGGTIVDFKRGSPDFAMQWYDANTGGPQFVFGDAATVNIRCTARATMATARYVTFVDAGTGTTFVCRDKGVGLAVDGANNIPAETAGTGFAIGNRPSFGQSFEGQIGEILVYGALSATDRDKVELYLKNKYGL